jgi:hypothetical protein
VIEMGKTYTGGGKGSAKKSSHKSGGKCGNSAGQSMDVWGKDKQSMKGSGKKK